MLQEFNGVATTEFTVKSITVFVILGPPLVILAIVTSIHLTAVVFGRKEIGPPVETGSHPIRIIGVELTFAVVMVPHFCLLGKEAANVIVIIATFVIGIVE